MIGISPVPPNLDEASLTEAMNAVREQQAWCPKLAEIPHYELQTLLSIAIRTFWKAQNARPHQPVKSPTKSSPSSSKKNAILRRDRFICYLCEKPIRHGQESVDHVIPKSKGGDHSPSNLRAAHTDCNFRKADMSLEEYRALYPMPVGQP